MTRVTGMSLRLWSGVIGFGRYHYTYASGREGEAPAKSSADLVTFFLRSEFARRGCRTGTVCRDNAAARLESTWRPRRSSVGLITLKEPMWILAVGVNNTDVGIPVGPALVHQVPAIR